MSPVALIAIAVLAQAPARPIDEATFLREAATGWALLEKAYANVEVRYRTEWTRGDTDEQSFSRLGKRLRAEQSERLIPDRPRQNPGFTRTYVTDGTACFIADRMSPNAPFLLRQYNTTRIAKDYLPLLLNQTRLDEMCYASRFRPWSEQIKRKGFSITRLDTIKVDSRDLIRMEYREDDQPAEKVSIVSGWCHFDPKENYAPVESEVEFLQRPSNYVGKIYFKIAYRPSDEFSGLRLVPSSMSETLIGSKGTVTSSAAITVDRFAPCKLKEADFRLEAFGLETPR